MFETQRRKKSQSKTIKNSSNNFDKNKNTFSNKGTFSNFYETITECITCNIIAGAQAIKHEALHEM
ncbi:MAG: hypothetical protein Q8O89_01890 [Nanoarchaeota archaeon]|nr:hypothetical protein [Nanoarchaeota archaeon]